MNSPYASQGMERHRKSAHNRAEIRILGFVYDVIPRESIWGHGEGLARRRTCRRWGYLVQSFGRLLARR